MKKFLLWPLLVVYILISVAVTVYLFNYNDYAVSQIGKHTVLVMTDDIGEFKENNIVIVKKNENKEINVDDYIFFYDINDIDNIINYGKVNKTEEVNETETTFTMSDNFKISSQYVIGKGDTSLSIPGLGSALNLLSSQWGFLFLIIVPVLILFIFQIYYFKLEMKGSGKKSKKKSEE